MHWRLDTGQLCLHNGSFHSILSSLHLCRGLQFQLQLPERSHSTSLYILGLYYSSGMRGDIHCGIIGKLINCIIQYLLKSSLLVFKYLICIEFNENNYKTSRNQGRLDWYTVPGTTKTDQTKTPALQIFRPCQ